MSGAGSADIPREPRGASSAPHVEALEPAVAEAVAQAHRLEWGRVLAATLWTVRDIDLAEECVQDAYVDALRSWTRVGVPDQPAAWLTTAARRRAIDLIRRRQTLRTKLPLLVEPTDDPESVEERVMEHLTELEADQGADDAVVVPDESLRLVFLCCHPALSQEAQAALTLRLVCGIETADIARLFLVSESTMAARITRAKKKIAGARIPFRLPPASELPGRLAAVLSVVYLLFTAGHTAPSGPQLVRDDAADAGVRLARLVHSLLPEEAEAIGLLALLLVIDARRDTRTGPGGQLLRLEEQDRSRWDRAALAEGEALILDALRRGRPGRYTLQAAIASLYAEPDVYENTDWPQILALYDALLLVWPSPVVALNRTVPLSHVAGPEAALAEVEQLSADPRLASYPYLPAVRADLLRRLDRLDDAGDHYREALTRTTNEAELAFLQSRLDELA